MLKLLLAGSYRAPVVPKKPVSCRRLPIKAPSDPTNISLPVEKTSTVSSNASVILVEIILKSARFPSRPPVVNLEDRSDLQRIRLSTIADPFFHPYSCLLHGMDPTIFFSSPWLLVPHCSFVMLFDDNPVPMFSETFPLQHQSGPPGLYRYCVTLGHEMWSILWGSPCESYPRPFPTSV